MKSPNYTSIRINGTPVKEHRLIMEQIIGRKLEITEIVHHVDGIKNNNHPDNLVITNRSEHARHHYKEDINKQKQWKSIQHLGAKSCIKVQKPRPEHPEFEGQRWNRHKDRRQFIVRKCKDCLKLVWQRLDNFKPKGYCLQCACRRANRIRYPRKT